jgi:predicted ribosome quality control (RQC) complex YloA/Tae2 family protein
MELAKGYHIEAYLTPAGGCLLTDPAFSRRLRDLFAHQDSLQIRDIELLKIGRHLRLSSAVKVVVGRRAQDNDGIAKLVAPGDDLLRVEVFPGPLCLIPYGGSMADIKKAASICVRYSDAPEDEEVSVLWSRNGEEKRIKVQSCPLSLPAELMI